MVEELTSDIAFTGAVKDVQPRLGSRAMFERMERNGGWQSEITELETEVATLRAQLDGSAGVKTV